MKLRAPLAAVLASVAVAASATACDTSNVGLAAKVDGTRITESQLSHYVTPAAQGVALQQSAPKTPPKSFVLFILVFDRLYADLLRSTKGGMPAPGVVSGAVSTFVGNRTPQQAVAGLGVHGYTAELDQAVLRFRALSTLLGERQQKGVDVSAALKKLSFPVTINPRYGTWNAKQFAIETGSSAGVPGFLQLQPAGGSNVAPGLTG
jgi:hypothetical protein